MLDVKCHLAHQMTGKESFLIIMLTRYIIYVVRCIPCNLDPRVTLSVRSYRKTSPFRMSSSVTQVVPGPRCDTAGYRTDVQTTYSGGTGGVLPTRDPCTPAGPDRTDLKPCYFCSFRTFTAGLDGLLYRSARTGPYED